MVKDLRKMSRREKDGYISQLNMTKRAVAAEITSIKQEMRDLEKQLEAKERRMREIDHSISELSQ